MKFMRPRFLGVFSFLAVLVIAPAARAFSLGESPDVRVDETASPAAATATCNFQPGAENTFSYIWTKPEALDLVAWRLPSCAACAGSGLNVTAVTIRMRWPFACTAQATVSIVGATNVNGCLRPDTNQVLCPPRTSTIRSTIQNIAVVTHPLPTSAGCCISGDAFVVIRFSGLGSCPSLDGTSPGLRASTGACAPCTQYFMASNFVLPGLQEWCQPVEPEDGAGPEFLMWMSVDANCCAITPTGRQSWGRVKSIYR